MSLLPHKVIYSQVPSLSMWASWEGGIILPTTATMEVLLTAPPHSKISMYFLSYYENGCLWSTLWEKKNIHLIPLLLYFYQERLGVLFAQRTLELTGAKKESNGPLLQNPKACINLGSYCTISHWPSLSATPKHIPTSWNLNLLTSMTQYLLLFLSD